jgi:hypothetical protein
MRSGIAAVSRFGVGFGKGFVGRSRRPADDDEEHIENEERDRDVVEESGKAGLGPELIAGPEEKRDRQQDRLREFSG